jgi:hypothetical protein
MDATNNPITYDNVVKHLLQRVPAFIGAYEQHLRECDEPIPVVLFGNLVDFTVDVYRSLIRSGYQRPDSHVVMSSVIDFLEEAANSHDKRVVDLVLTGFLENLDPNNPEHQSIAVLLKPESQKLLQLSRT